MFNRSFMIPSLLGALALTIGIIAPGAHAQQAVDEVVEDEISTEYQSLRVTRVADGLDNPWAIAFLGDDRMLVSERPGRLQHIQNGTVTEVGGLPDDIHVQNQGGLLDVVPHPEYESNGWIYVTYSKGDDDGTVPAMIRARLEGSTLTDLEQLYEANEVRPPGRHYGSRILFLNDGTLLVTVGDSGSEPERAQDTSDHTGSVVRLNDDGSVADGNPFAENAEYAPEIYSYGHRNIQGIVQHPETGEIWATEHGPRGSDELNLIEAGENYGWPTVSLGRDYGTQEPWSEERRRPEFREPVFEFLPTLAPSGLAVIDGGDWDDTWQGNLLAGGLRSERILRLMIEDREVVHAEELLRGMVGRIRDVRQGPDGNIYVAAGGEDNGAVYRVEPVD